MAPLRAKSKLQIIRCFKIMEMPIETIEKESLRKQYYKISRKFHPDLCTDEFQDGNMFAKMKAAYDFLRNNMGIINLNIEFIKEFKINNEKPEEEIVETKIEDVEETKVSESVRLDREASIFKCEEIIEKQTNNYKTIKNCIKIDKALDELAENQYEKIEEMKNKIENIYETYKPYKLVKNDYILVILLAIFSVIIAVIAIPTTIWFLLILSFICLLGCLFLIFFCNRHKKNTVFYTELTGKTLK